MTMDVVMNDDLYQIQRPAFTTPTIKFKKYSMIDVVNDSY